MLTRSLDAITMLALGGPAVEMGISTIPLPTPPAISPEQAEREVLELERARNEAIRTGDRQALARIYADDFVGVTTTGSVVDKDAVLHVLAGVDQRLSFTFEDLRVRLFCDTALVTGKMTGRMTGSGVIEGPESVSAFWYTHVYVQQKGRWVLVAGQSTNVSP
jgi:uncharacterized protein (TIGR02246 family)